MSGTTKTGRLAGKVAMVVGAGSSGPGWGNGKATAVLFAREGARLFCVDIDLAAAEETAAIIRGEGGTAVACRADVSQAADVEAMVAACLEAYGRIDVLDNNVGIVQVGGPVETSEESWDRVIDVNLKSMFLTCKQVLPETQRLTAATCTLSRKTTPRLRSFSSPIRSSSTTAARTVRMLPIYRAVRRRAAPDPS